MGKTRRDREEAAQRLIPRATTVLGLTWRTARVPEGRFAWWQHAPATRDPALPRAEVPCTPRSQNDVESGKCTADRAWAPPAGGRGG